VSRRLRAELCCGLLLAWLAPSVVAAQSAPPAAPTVPPDEAAEASRWWLVAGGTFATVRGDCQTCEEDFPYRHAGGVLANVGYRVNYRMDVGGELYWMPTDTAQGRILTTHIDAVAQFRPWASQGFFVKGGTGMAYVRNWVDAIGPDPINSKAWSVVIGGGWAFRPAARVGLQVFGAQHVAALGDLQTAEEDIPDVVGNFWTLGVAIVIR
jgi:Outer membrane protein beta-barrel domain